MPTEYPLQAGAAVDNTARYRAGAVVDNSVRYRPGEVVVNPPAAIEAAPDGTFTATFESTF